MEPSIAKEERNGWPSQARPDRKLAEPWSTELLVAVNHLHHHCLSPDGKYIVFIWQRDGNSDIWLMRSNGYGWPERITVDRPQQSFWTDDQPRWSPDSKWIVFSAQEDLWVVSRKGGKARRLTDFKLGDGHPIFSPDGSRIYFLSGRKEFLNLCWTTLDADWPNSLTNLSADVTDPQPSPDGALVAFVYHPQDDLNRAEICLVPEQGGELRHLTGSAQVRDYQPRWSPDNQYLSLISNRSGWNNLYLLQVSSGNIRQLTTLEADVKQHAWSHDGKRIALVISHQGTTRLEILDLVDQRRKTLHEGKGWHSFPQWGPDDDWVSVEFESPVQPPDIFRINVKNGRLKQLTFSTPASLKGTQLVQPEFIQFPSTNDSLIPGFLFRPPGASPEKPCPAIVYPHGGPTDEYACFWEMLTQWLVAKGYAVLAPNYRGSTGYGLAHQFALHQHWGIVDTEDMLAAADYLSDLDWVDGRRLGIYGASYGSYLALLALARDPQYRFKCGVAKYGDCDILASWAQGDRPGREDLERQMGHPLNNLDGYRAGSPIYEAANIKSPLLILHGDQDRRVHPKQSEQLVETLCKENKVFEYILYRGEGHGLLNKANLLHFYATLERFLDWYLI
ncbi:MAG: prolyl oligopeptidase family serine peptidase [Anaerolineales bacterium]|jgi:dipeptidyl aminopeptidase/acylaminoacyl peptidase